MRLKKFKSDNSSIRQINETIIANLKAMTKVSNATDKRGANLSPIKLL